MNVWSDGGSLVLFVVYGWCVVKEVIEDVGMTSARDASRDDVGVSFGAGMGGVSDLMCVGGWMVKGELWRILLYFVLWILVNVGVGRILMDYGFRGSNLAAATACATSAYCIGDVFRVL